MSWKKELVNIAKKEALECNKATNHENSGELVEKYLLNFRDILDKKEGKTYFTKDKRYGFDWCAAFVYYCLKQSGYKLPLEPFKDKPTFAYVKTWYDYANVCADWEWEEDITKANAGDLVIFRRTSSNSEFNHIGIVVGINHKKKYMLVSEGNVNRRTQVMVRSFDFRIKGLIKIGRN